ncbi:MAG: alpha/beta hydrolase [Acutalibacteraceae bacterium]
MNIYKPLIGLFWKIISVINNKRIAAQIPDSGVVSVIDLPYTKSGISEHMLDIYYPENTSQPLPVIIDIHGGGWVYGCKEINRNFCLKLAKKGFLVVSINYRPVGKHLFHHQIEDVFAALNWISDNLNEYPADMSSVFLLGDSAGGQLACLSAAIMSDKKLEGEFNVTIPSFKISAVGAISPAVNLLCRNFLLYVNLPSLLGKKHKDSRYYKYMDFAGAASGGLPPFYIVTSAGDFLNKQAYMLAEILKSHNIPYSLHDYDKAHGGKKLSHVFAVADPYSQQASEVIGEMSDFFYSSIKNTPDSV